MAVHRPSADFPRHLRALYRRFPFDRSLAEDPLSGVRPLALDPWHAEVAGILAATIAVGNTTSIRRAFADLVERLDGDLAGWVDSARDDRPDPRLEGFHHRWIRAEHLEYLGYRLHEIRARSGSLEEVFRAGLGPEGDFAGGIDRLAHALRGPEPGAPGPRPPPGYLRLFPTPLGPNRSPCKRLTLFVRWMVRTEYPDLGMWRRVSPAVLRVPLDQHVYWIAYHLGLTARRSRTWATVEEVTAALRKVDGNDPVRFDFVLCHTGISGDCPKRADLRVCGPCVVRPDCRLWRGRKGIP